MNQLDATANEDDANILGYLNVLNIRRTPAGREGHTVGGTVLPEVAPATVMTAGMAHRLVVSGGNGGRTASTQKVKNEYLSGTDHFVMQNALFHAPNGAVGTVTAMLADPDVRTAMGAHTANSAETDLAIARYCLSRGYNTDPRDWGFLDDPANRCTIDAWTINEPTDPVIASKICSLKPYTEAMMAALNATKVTSMEGRWGVWTTVLAISMRYFPSSDQFRGGGAQGDLSYLHTRGLVPEYVLTLNMPEIVHVSEMTGAYASFFGDIIDYAVWDGSRFGATHLGHDHTYKPNDANLNRVNKAVIDTGRTLVNWPDNHAETLNTQSHRQQNGRSLKHPLGLASTFAMFKFGALTDTIPPALQIRYPVIPPRVQKLYIFIAGMDQMEVLKVGRQLKIKRRDVYDGAVVVAADVSRNAPAYSDLHELYGVKVQLKPDEALMTSVTALLPVIYGYAQVYNIKDGDADQTISIGLALSTALANVARDHPAMCKQMSSMFANIYTEAVQGDPTDEILRLIG